MPLLCSDRLRRDSLPPLRYVFLLWILRSAWRSGLDHLPNLRRGGLLKDGSQFADRLLPKSEDQMNAWIRSKFDIDPCCRLREAFLFWLKRKLLWDDKGSAESRSEWLSWMFFHWLRTGRWESGYEAPVFALPTLLAKKEEGVASLGSAGEKAMHDLLVRIIGECTGFCQMVGRCVRNHQEAGYCVRRWWWNRPFVRCLGCKAWIPANTVTFFGEQLCGTCRCVLRRHVLCDECRTMPYSDTA
jgi:hypothetical protein